MKIYTSKKDETVKVKIVEENEKFKTVLVEFLTGPNKGTTRNITTSTLKRWYKLEKECDVEPQSEKPVESEKPIIKKPEDKKPEVKKETKKVAKKSGKKKKEKESVKIEDKRLELKEMLIGSLQFAGIEFKTYDKLPFRVMIQKNSKNVIYVIFNKKNVMLRVKSPNDDILVDYVDGVETGCNHHFDCKGTIKYSGSYNNAINAIVACATKIKETN